MRRILRDLKILILANLWLVPVLAGLVGALFYFVAPPPPMHALPRDDTLRKREFHFLLSGHADSGSGSGWVTCSRFISSMAPIIFSS